MGEGVENDDLPIGCGTCGPGPFEGTGVHR